MPRVRWSPDTAHHKSERLRFMSSSPSNLRPQLQSKDFEGRTSLGISEPNMHRRGRRRLDRANRVKASSAYLFFEAGLYSYACSSNLELMSGQEGQGRKQSHVNTMFLE